MNSLATFSLTPEEKKRLLLEKILPINVSIDLSDGNRNKQARQRTQPKYSITHRSISQT